MDSSKYGFLYDGSRPNWILVVIDGRTKIYNAADHVILNAFAPDLESEIIERMKKRGIRILESLPGGKVSTPRAQLKSSDWVGLRAEMTETEVPESIRRLIKSRTNPSRP